MIAAWLWVSGTTTPIAWTAASWAPILARVVAVWWVGLSVALPIVLLILPPSQRAAEKGLVLAPIVALVILAAAIPAVCWLAGWPLAVALTVLLAGAIDAVLSIAMLGASVDRPPWTRSLLAAACVIGATGVPALLDIPGTLHAFASLSDAAHAPATQRELPLQLVVPLLVPAASLVVILVASRARPR